MGKGDRRTKRGKIWHGTTGKYRSKSGPGPSGNPEPVPSEKNKPAKPAKGDSGAAKK